MKINTSAPASAPTPEQPAEVENESVAENGSADFSALLFFMLATPQVQPLPNGEMQSATATGIACADGVCAAPVLLAQPGENLLAPSMLADANANGEDFAAALPLADVGKGGEIPLANLIADETAQTIAPVVSEGAAAELAPEPTVSEAPIESNFAPVRAAAAHSTNAVNAAKQLADEAAEQARAAGQEDEARVNPLLQRDGFGSHSNGQQIGAVSASDALDGTGIKDRRDKDGLEKPGVSDHSLQPAQLSSFAAALHNSQSAQRSEGAAAPFASPVIDRVANEIATQVRTSQNEAIITLDPPELGSLRIALTLDGDKVQARIIAEMTDSGNLIHNHLPELKEALSGHRLDLVDVHIDSGNWNGTSSDFTQNFNREFTDQRQERGGRAAADRPFADNPQAAPVTSRPQPASSRTARVSMWA